MNSENRKSLTLEYTSYNPAAIAVIIGVALVFNTEFIFEIHDKVLLWFAFALLAILIPYISEITMKNSSYQTISPDKTNQYQTMVTRCQLLKI